MKYFTLRFLDNDGLLEELTTNKPYESVSTKLIKSMMKLYEATECEVYTTDTIGGYVFRNPIKTITLK